VFLVQGRDVRHVKAKALASELERAKPAGPES
jgi:hypothetical protein